MDLQEMAEAARKHFGDKVRIRCDDKIDWIYKNIGSSDGLRIVDGRLLNIMGEDYGPAEPATLVHAIENFCWCVDTEPERWNKPNAHPKGEDAETAKKLGKRLAQSVQESVEATNDFCEWLVEMDGKDMEVEVQKGYLSVEYNGKVYSFRIKLVPIDAR